MCICDEFVPNCLVVFQARCFILLPKIPEHRCLQGSPDVKYIYKLQNESPAFVKKNDGGFVIMEAVKNVLADFAR